MWSAIDNIPGRLQEGRPAPKSKGNFRVLSVRHAYKRVAKSIYLPKLSCFFAYLYCKSWLVWLISLTNFGNTAQRCSKRLWQWTERVKPTEVFFPAVRWCGDCGHGLLICKPPLSSMFLFYLHQLIVLMTSLTYPKLSKLPREAARLTTTTQQGKTLMLAN